jgi:uncharacterized protein YcbX
MSQMMNIGTVACLWRYPVKSMLGEELDAAAIGERGLAGDRAFAVVDRATGKVASAKHPRLWGQLLTCYARIAAPPDRDASAAVLVILPDGRSVVAGDPTADVMLSAALGREVTLAATVPATAELEKYWPDLDGMPFRDTLTTGAIGLGAPPGTFFDYAPIHLLTTATLDRLQTLYPAGRFAPRRFRPNLVITPANGADGFVENNWVGQTFLIGQEVRLRVIDPTPRCVVTTLPQADLPRDIGILKTVAAHNRTPIPALAGEVMPSVGVYAVVEQRGTVRRGDPIRLSG